MPQHAGPVPVPTPETRPYWEAARRHALELPRCCTCGHCFFYPRAACPRCLSGDLEYKDNQGKQQFGSFEVQERWERVDQHWLLIRLVSRLGD